jgi:hypothetical protein
VDSTSQALEWFAFPGVMEPWFAQMRDWQETQKLPNERIYPDIAQVWERQPVGFVGAPKSGLQVETIVFENGATVTRNAPPRWWQ